MGKLRRFFGGCRIRAQTMRGTICWRCCSSRWRQCCAERNRARIWRTLGSRRKGCCGSSFAWSMASRATNVQPGVPSAQAGDFRTLTFRRFMAAFAKANGLNLTGVVAIDGKALRGAYQRGGAAAPLQMVNVFAVDARMALAQQKAPGRNETAGALEVLDLLSLEGCTVTADALHCHRAFAAAVRQRGGDYVLAIKANRGACSRRLCNSSRAPASAASPSTSTCPVTIDTKRAVPLSCATPAWLPAMVFRASLRWPGYLAQTPARPACRCAGRAPLSAVQIYLPQAIAPHHPQPLGYRKPTPLGEVDPGFWTGG